MLHDFCRQIAKKLFLTGAVTVLLLTTSFAQLSTADADMDAVIGQTGVRHVGENDEVVGNDAGFSQLGHRVKLTAT